MIALLLCFAGTQAACASDDDDVDIDIPIGCEDHSYGSWSSNGNGTHSRSCPTCYDKQTQTCVWDSGTVTREASCKEEGQKVRTCTVCRGTKTETVPRTSDHTPGSSWQADKDHHWRSCTLCNAVLEKDSHRISGSYCTTCNRRMETQSAHVHQYASAWTADETGHWHACSGCTEKSAYADHSFENACDSDCDICGYTRTVIHSPESDWNTDKNGHWKLCGICGQKCEEAAHTPGPAATVTAAQMCTVCSFELAPVIAEAPPEETRPTAAETTEAEETVEETEPAREDAPSVEKTPEEPDSTWLFAGLALSVAALMAVIVIVLRIDKKSK